MHLLAYSREIEKARIDLRGLLERERVIECDEGTDPDRMPSFPNDACIADANFLGRDATCGSDANCSTRKAGALSNIGGNEPAGAPKTTKYLLPEKRNRHL